MNQSNKDLISYIDSIPYGSVVVRVERVNRKTTKITTTGEETLKYVDNDEAKNDLLGMIDNLIEIGYTGEAHVKLEMKDGKITLMGIFNKKETQY